MKCDPASIIAALPIALLVIDPKGYIAQVNAATETLLNTSESHLLGRKLAEMLTLPAQFNLSSDTPFAAYDVDVAIHRHGPLRLDVAVVPLPNALGWHLITLHGGGHGSGYGRERSSVRQSGRSAISMAAMMAHEIKNPLSGIRGAAQLLGTQAHGALEQQMTTLIRDEVDRIAGLIDQMQGFTDTRPQPRTAENIYAILEHVRALAKNGFAHGVEIRDRYDPSLPKVSVHKDALVQILLNLLKNAAEAIDTAGIITITTAYRHGVTVRMGDGDARVSLPIEICIIDNGPGPPPEIAENLFDPFVTSKTSGKGLGLALADKLVRDMGGLLQFSREGTPPQTVFRLLLQRATKEMEGQP